MQKINYKDIDEYISLQPEKVRASLEQIRQLIRKAAPGAREVISYQMPAFRNEKILAWFAAFRDHYGFFVQPETVQAFSEKLQDYKCSKGTIRFPLDKPLPSALITEIIKYRVAKESKGKSKNKE